MKQYEAKFHKVDGSDETRQYTLISSSTNKARSIVKQFVRINSDNTMNVNSEYLNTLLERSEILNKMMQSILTGDHSNIDWFDAETTITDEIISDFFQSFQ